MEKQFEAVIGLEVHCQLATDSKIFSSDSAAFESEPNVHIHPLTLGHPGTLPVLNERAVEYAIRMGLATRSTINSPSVFARKHYFYPDLPKGYQISQFDRPLCSGGYIEIPNQQSPDSMRRVRLTRIHLEEDAGKSIHTDHATFSLLDYNRSGVPLIEIVSEPDLHAPREAYDYVRKIRQLVRYLGICDGNMEEGSLRCDANISVREKGAMQLGQKTEIKNLNSFRFLEKALEYEIERQVQLLVGGGKITSETRLWDDEAGRTRSMRSKEEAHDYRYFPDPDLPPVRISEDQIERARATLPELPDHRVRRYESAWGLPRYDADVLTAERAVADYFESCIQRVFELQPDLEAGDVAKAVSNFMMTHVLRVLKEQAIDADELPVTSELLAGLILLRLQDRVSSTGAQAIFESMLVAPGDAQAIAASQNLMQVKDTATLQPFIEHVIQEYPEHVDMYLNGKLGLIGFFIGHVMRACPGSPDPREVRSLLEASLESLKT